METAGRKDVEIKQLTALAQAQADRARAEKIATGHVSPEVIAEVYRIYHQILAVMAGKELDVNDPDYQIGLLEALLTLHQKKGVNETRLYGAANAHTVSEIARLEYLLKKLYGQRGTRHYQQASRNVPGLVQLEVTLTELLR